MPNREAPTCRQRSALSKTTYLPRRATIACGLCSSTAGSASGMNDQYIDVGPGGDSSGDREHPPDERGSRVQSHIANHQQIGPNLLGKVHQRMYWCSLNRPVLDVLRPGRLCSVAGIMQHRVGWRVAAHLVALLPEDVGRAQI